MEIYPSEQLRLLLFALSGGILLGAFYEVLRALRILFGIAAVPPRLYPLYEKKLPLIGCAPNRGETTARKIRRELLLFAGDLLFTVTAAVAVECLLFTYNDGEFRISVLVLAIFGFALWRVSVAKFFSFLTPYLAYIMSVIFLYVRVLLSLPIKGAVLFFRLLLRGAICLGLWAKRPFVRFARSIRYAMQKKTSRALMAGQCVAARSGFGYLKQAEAQKKGGFSDGKQKKKAGSNGKKRKKQQVAACDQAPYCADLFGGAHHFCASADRIQ